MGWSGFCVGGITWPRPELAGLTDPGEIAAALSAVGAREAELAAREGGNLLRLFYDVASVFPRESQELGLALGTFQPGEYAAEGLFRVPVEERLEQLDGAVAVLDRVRRGLAGEAELEVDLDALDAYLAGMAGTGVKLLLTLVMPVPRRVIECPGDATLAAHGRAYTATEVRAAYVDVHAELQRVLYRRFVAQPSARGEEPVVVAFELGNEPDYVWIPEEMKIEGASEPLVTPLWKYVTELHLPQVPERMEPAAPFERTPWGFQEQDAGWATPGPPTPLRDFEWGRKFDFYLRCFGDLQAACAAALRAEAEAAGVPVEVVSGSVTHNNLDYLVRLERARPGAFADVTAIGLHPYHWVNNDVWDERYVDPAHDAAGWADVSPREFARDYLKRFDFLAELARWTRPRRRSWGARAEPPLERDLRAVFEGRRLWVTEFGIGTKALGAFNAPVAAFNRFIRPRGDVGAAGEEPAAIWEDLWESFLGQVHPGFLAEHAVDCLMLYALRESGGAGFDMDDEDRSNFGLLRRDGAPRLEAGTQDGVRGLLSEVSGTGAHARRSIPSRPGAELHRRPWRGRALPADVAGVKTMLTPEERQLLTWLTAEWYRGEGAIVDAGCFVGGSTLALGRGLEANPAGAQSTLEVYDLFVADDFAATSYLAEHGIAEGQSFRPVFDEVTASVAGRLNVHEGDFHAERWDGRPIEILFIDIAKSWSLDDAVVSGMFPSLIPDRSVVVQQDLVFPFCPWLAVTMERLADYFEPVAFVEVNSLVYLCRRPVPPEVAAQSSSALPAAEQLALMDRAIGRMRGYPRALLECARVVLLALQGDRAAARERLEPVLASHGDHPLLIHQLGLVQTMLAEG